MGLTKDNGMLIDIQYVDNKGEDDCIYTIWKDLDTGEKNLSIEKKPTRIIYFEKPDCRNHKYNKTYERLENLIPVEVKEKNLIYEIANHIGDDGKRFVKECFDTRDYKRLNDLQLYPYVFGSDLDIRGYKRLQWKNNYDNKRPKHLSLGFLDIEVDIMEGGPDPTYNPIDLVTLIDVDKKDVYTFALTGVDYKEPKKIKPKTEYEIQEEEKKKSYYKHRMNEQEYWSSHVDELIKKAHEKFDESYKGFTYHINFYQNELMMLVHLWQLINTLKLDMIGIWNMDFDIPFIYNRLLVLGVDPKDIMCHKDFPIKQCYYKKDMRHFAIKEKSSWFNLSSYTIFVDQMVIYAALRKGQSELRSNKLTYIAEKEIGDKKLDYSEVGTIKTLSYTNYLLYILYNIKDVLLQVGIENRTSDMDTYYLTSYVNITPYEDVFKQSVKLRFVQYASYMSQGLIIGNNMNNFNFSWSSSDNEDDSTFEGALVGNPKLIDNFGMELFGKKTNFLFQYSIDFDMSRFYPSCIIAMNIDPSTLIFKLLVDSSQFNVRGGELKYRGITDTHIVKGNSDTFSGDIGKEIIDNYQTGNVLTFGNKWLNLPSVESMCKKIRKELS